MKKLKTLCAVVGAAAILCGWVTFAAEQKYEVPEYDLKDAVKTKKEIPLSSGSKLIYEVYTLDRNKDGKMDLIEKRFFYYKKGKLVEHMKFLYLDDDFDTYADRELKDWNADNIYDEEFLFEDPKLPIDKFTKIYLR